MLNNKMVFISGLAMIFVVLLLLMTRKETPPKIITAEDEMPDFNFQLITGGFVQRADMDTEKYTLISFFHSECNICVNETRSLVDSVSLLNNCQIVMVSPEDSIKVAEFQEQFRLSDIPSIHVAYMPEYYINSIFKIYVIPTLYIYHPDRRMIKYKPGPVTIQEIVEYLK